MADRLQTEQVASNVLIVAAVDIVGIRTRGSGVADGNAGDDSNGKAVSLKLPGQRFNLLACRVDIDGRVVGFDARAQGRRT